MPKELPQLKEMSNEAKDDLIRELWKEIECLRSKVKELEQKPVKKTSKNSSVPPSKGFKANQTEEKKTEKRRKKNHQEGGRELNPNPDQIVIAKAKTCPHCGTEVNREKQKLTGIYERIELPIVKPVITRVERYGGMCECCQQKYESPVPVGLEAGSPFGNKVASMVSYLRYSHGISYERLSRLMGEVYGLKISEGAIANLLKRVQSQLESPLEDV